MNFKILGPLRVLDEGEELEIRSPKERTVLAVLLLHAPAVVSRERLVDELWHGSPPATAAKALNVHVSQLRKALARNGGDFLRTRSPGYALEVDPTCVDARLFERQAAEARDELAAGRLEQARSSFDGALALWRGRALEDLELEPETRIEVARLEELRLGVQMDRIDCDLALGRHATLVGELEKLVAEHPLHERLRAQLMLALYRSGRQADALASYRDARRALVEELGIEPSAPLQRLEKAILNQDPSLGAPAGVVAEEPGETPSLPAPERPPQRAARQRLRGKQGLVLAAVAAGAVVAGIVLAVTLNGGSSSNLGRVDANSVGVIDPSTGNITAEISTGSAPSALTLAGGEVWVANEGDKTVAAIDPHTHAIRSIAVPGHPSALSGAYGALWVANGAEQTVVRIDLANGFAGKPIAIPGPPERRALGIAARANGAWLALPGTQVERITPSGEVTLRRELAAGVVPTIATAGDTVWVGGSGAVTPLDTRTGLPGAPVQLAGDPDALAAGFGSLWAVVPNELQRVDLGNRVVTATIAVGHNPSAVADVAGRVWVANSSDGTVSEIDPTRNEVARTVRVGGSPIALTGAEGKLWVAVR